MRLAIFGATGFVGKVLLRKALDTGHDVRALVRTPEKLGELKDRVELVKGDLFDADGIEKVVEGADAVLSTVGPPRRMTRTPADYEGAMRRLVTAIEKQGIRRFIHIGGAAHDGGENEHWTLGRRSLRIFLSLMVKPILVAKYLEWEVLKASRLDWTLVRPPRIVTGTPKGRVVADEKNLVRVQVNVEDLADFILAQLSSNEWIKKAPLVASP
jgi:nucleoside-diphosphate-sugar epimerase